MGKGIINLRKETNQTFLVRIQLTAQGQNCKVQHKGAIQELAKRTWYERVHNARFDFAVLLEGADARLCTCV